MRRLLWPLLLLPSIAFGQSAASNLSHLAHGLLSGGIVPCANGGTGSSAIPSNGYLLIGNGTCFTLATITAGANITITNSAGGITIASTATGSGTVSDGSGTTTANEVAVSTSTAHVIGYATTLPASALPALAGDVTSSAGSNSVTVSKVSGAGTPTDGQFFGYTTAGGQGWYSLTGGSFPTCTLGQLVYYAANGSTGSCLTLGTNLSLSGSTLNAGGGGYPNPTTTGDYDVHWDGTSQTLVQLTAAQVGTGTMPSGTTWTIDGVVQPQAGVGHINSDEGNGVAWPTTCTGVASWSNTGTPTCTNPTGGVGISANQVFTQQLSYAPTLTSNAYTVQTSDWSQGLKFSNGATAVTLNVPTANSTGFGSGFYFYVYNEGTAAVTITPATGTIDGNATFAINAGGSCMVSAPVSGTDWQTPICNASPGSGGGSPAIIAWADNGISASSNQYDAPGVRGSSVQLGIVAPRSGTVENFTVIQANVPASGQTFVYTVGVGAWGTTPTSTFTCTITNTSGLTPCDPATGTLSVTQGQEISVNIATGTTATANQSISLEIQ